MKKLPKSDPRFKTGKKTFITLEEKVNSCEHSRFCETFGEYKCLKKERRVVLEIDCVGCKNYKKVNPLEKPDFCQCKTCSRRNTQEDS